MKPTFLDAPDLYTRASRNEADPIRYACSVSHQTPSGYGWKWWACIAAIAAATLVVVTL